jgi:hypothetical protein
MQEWTAEAEFTTAAAPAHVWAALAEVDSWSRWSPLPFRVRGQLIPDAPMWLGFRAGGRARAPFGTVWRVVAPERELSWGGGFRHVLDITHGFTITELDSVVTVRQFESFVGPAARLMPDLLLPVWRVFFRHINNQLQREITHRSQGATHGQLTDGTEECFL